MTITPSYPSRPILPYSSFPVHRLKGGIPEIFADALLTRPDTFVEDPNFQARLRLAIEEQTTQGHAQARKRRHSHQDSNHSLYDLLKQIPAVDVALAHQALLSSGHYFINTAADPNRYRFKKHTKIAGSVLPNQNFINSLSQSVSAFLFPDSETLKEEFLKPQIFLAQYKPVEQETAELTTQLLQRIRRFPKTIQDSLIDALTNRITNPNRVELKKAYLTFARELAKGTHTAQSIRQILEEVFSEKNASSQLDPFSRLGLFAAKVSRHSYGAFDGLIRFIARSVMETVAKNYIIGFDGKEALKNAKILARQGQTVILDHVQEFVQSDEGADNVVEKYMSYASLFAQDKQLIRLVRANRPRHTNRADFKPENQYDFELAIKFSSLTKNFDPENFEASTQSIARRFRKILDHVMELNKDDVRIGITIDLEQFMYRDMTYAIFKNVLSESKYKGLTNVGIVIQAYYRDAEFIIDDLASWSKNRHAENGGASISVRLVNGAYHEFEVSEAKEKGYDCPVFEDDRAQSAANYRRCIDRLFYFSKNLRLSAASHNAETLSYVISRGQSLKKPFSIQMLFGIGHPLSNIIANHNHVPVAVYAPIGLFKDGIHYLIRRVEELATLGGFLNLTKGTNLNNKTIIELSRPPEEILRRRKLSLPRRIVSIFSNPSGLLPTFRLRALSRLRAHEIKLGYLGASLNHDAKKITLTPYGLPTHIISIPTLVVQRSGIATDRLHFIEKRNIKILQTHWNQRLAVTPTKSDLIDPTREKQFLNQFKNEQLQLIALFKNELHGTWAEAAELYKKIFKRLSSARLYENNEQENTSPTHFIDARTLPREDVIEQLFVALKNNKPTMIISDTDKISGIAAIVRLLHATGIGSSGINVFGVL